MNPQLGQQQPPHDAAALARHILSQARFRVFVHAARPHTWWDTIRQWIADRWNQLLDAFSHHVHIGTAWSIATGDVLIAAVIAIVVAVIVRLLLTISKDQSAGGMRESALPQHADPEQLRAAALLAAQNGAYAGAVALLFQAVLALLDARGLLRDDPARTVNECRADVRRRAAQLSAPFDRIARLFTAAVYAEDRMSLAECMQAQEAYAAFAAVQHDAA